MASLPVDPEYLVPRGVHRAPCLSPSGERILYAVDHNHRLLKNGWIYVGLGDNPLPASAELWSRLDHEDPEPAPISAAAS